MGRLLQIALQVPFLGTDAIINQIPSTKPKSTVSGGPCAGRETRGMGRRGTCLPGRTLRQELERHRGRRVGTRRCCRQALWVGSVLTHVMVLCALKQMPSVPLASISPSAQRVSPHPHPHGCGMHPAPVSPLVLGVMAVALTPEPQTQEGTSGESLAAKPSKSVSRGDVLSQKHPIWCPRTKDPRAVPQHLHTPARSRAAAMGEP